MKSHRCAAPGIDDCAARRCPRALLGTLLATIALAHAGPAEAKPDLIVRGVYIDSKCYIYAAVAHIGPGALATHGTYLRVSGLGLKSDAYVRRMLPGEALKVPLGRVQGGRHTLVVTIDPDRLIDEANEGNNRKKVTVNCTGRLPAGKPKIAVEDLSLDHNCHFAVHLRNAGPGALPDAAYRASNALGIGVASLEEGKAYSWAASSLVKADPLRRLQNPGGRLTVVLVKRRTTSIRMKERYKAIRWRLVTFVAKVRSNVPKKDGNRFGEISRRLACLPDLHVEIRRSPVYLRAGQSGRFSAVVRNLGPVSAGKFALQLRVGGAPARRLLIPTLASGASRSLHFDTTLSQPGRYAIQASVAIGNMVEVPTHNFAEGFVDIKRSYLADLAVTKLEVLPPKPRPGKPFVVRVTLANQGDRPAAASYLLSVGPGTARRNPRPIPIAARSTRVITHSFKAPSLPLPYRITFTADPENRVREESELNNKASRSLFIR